ncbi:MAG: hypothetical protein BWY93_00661 [Euryarchaeota archaeon ADurb.BinA087]|nr:MAG: hypothetical protein BWY93_00661 [Euryarchaeota archaeon ADurb.BinA087]
MSIKGWICFWLIILCLAGIVYAVSSAVSFVNYHTGILDPSVKELETGEKSVSFDYTLHGNNGAIQTTVYEGVYNYLSEKRPKSGRYLDVFSDRIQDKYSSDLIRKIQAVSTNHEDQARVAISIVQQIQYSDGLDYFWVEYPYERLYYNWGDCSQKSVLLAYILKQLGFGVALLEFEDENHMVVGIATNEKFSYKNTGYAFVETTLPRIITDASGQYGENITSLTSVPEVIVICYGQKMSNLDQDVQDAASLLSLKNKGKKLNEKDYSNYVAIRDKYGLDKGIRFSFDLTTPPTIQPIPPLPPPPIKN